jgi:hypothetical protein
MGSGDSAEFLMEAANLMKKVNSAGKKKKNKNYLYLLKYIILKINYF